MTNISNQNTTNVNNQNTMIERGSKMNEMQIFKNEEFGQMRTITIDNEPWFVGKDVALALGYNNTRKALDDHVDQEDKLQGDGVTIRDSIGREQHPTIINESGLYSLVLSSKLPGAKKFKRWVTSEVIPSIRKHGMYVTESTLEKVMNDPDFMIGLLQNIKEERRKNEMLLAENSEKQKVIEQQTEQIEEMKPKVSYYDIVLNCKDLISTSAIAKDYGKSAVWMNKYLHDKGIQFKQGDVWLLYQRYAEQGYTGTKTHTYSKTNGELGSKMHTYWTQKGRLFIYDLMKEDNILPLVERED